MFNSDSIEYLEQALGYEQWVLAKSIDLLKRSKGYVSSRTIIIKDDNSLEVQLLLKDEFGLEKAVDVINELSPLLFNASYKILDMLMEWIIRENRGDCPWRFSEKISLLEDSDSTFFLPYPLGEDPSIFAYFERLYRNLSDLRNALTHGVWGRNLSGNLEFNFKKRNRIIQQTIPFEQVIRFADCMSLCGREAICPSTQAKSNIVSTLKWCLDELQSIHGLSKYGITTARYFDVIRKTKQVKLGFVVIDINFIKEILNHEAMGYPYDYFLRIESEIDNRVIVWEIPSNLIGNSEELILDGNWDGFKTPNM